MVLTGTRVNWSGLVVAGIGFFLTRFTVTLTVYQDTVRFYLAGVVPLALGLGLAAFGVALTVADVDASVVRTTALWCVIGAGTMLVLVVLTLLGSTAGGMPDIAAVRSRTYLSNFLIGGSIGGTLTGLYASRTRSHHSEIQQQANRLEVLNRMLRHEVLNSLTAIQGYAGFVNDETTDAKGVIERRSKDIEGTIAEVKHLTQTAGTSEIPLGAIDIGDCLRESVAAVEEQYPEADISVGSYPEELQVRANERLDQVLVHLIENATIHATEEGPTVEVSVTATANSVRVSVTDEGPGLPESQQALLETGDIDEFDNPKTGFGLNIVRIHVEEYGGTIETDVGEDGTTISVGLPRAGSAVPGLQLRQSDLTAVRPALPHLLVTLAAAVIAAVPYGSVAEFMGGSVAFIGVYYGVQNPVIGWLTHEFHSVVFGFVFAGLVSLAPTEYHDRLSTYLAIGVGWAMILWIVAAGIISPIWLQLLVGIPQDIPSLSRMLFWTHLVWGITLGILTHYGYRYVVPWLARLVE